MEGTLKKWTSIFRGYQSRWVILTFDGYLKYYEGEPEDLTEPPKGKLKLSLSDIVRRDVLRFRIIADDGQKFSFKAEDEEQADQWMEMLEQIKSSARHDISDAEDGDEDVDSESIHQDDPDSISVKSRESLKDETSHVKRHISFKNVVKGVVTAKQITDQFRRLMIDRKRKNFKVVAAIDFGSSNTCCAYSLKSWYTKDPLHVHVIHLSENYKDPTVLLLNPDGEFDSFGTKAEERFTELKQADPEGVKNWYMFKNFKMQLYGSRDVNKFMMVKDVCGKSMKASHIFALCIEYLHDKLFEKIRMKDRSFKDYDIRWVITCPAMWNEAARQFMIEAAEMGGINRDSITLVLEPEAAAIYCKCLDAQNKLRGNNGESLFSPGTRFLIVDLGGGAVDITASEVMESGQIKEIYNASGGPWGGDMINHKIWILVHDVFGNAVIQNFMNNARDDYLHMVRNVEEAKKSYDFEDRFVIDIPDSLLAEAKKLNSDLTYDRNKEAVKVVKSRLQIEPKFICKIFQTCIDTLCQKIKDVLGKTEAEGISSILWVGGYSSCRRLKETVKETFTDIKLIYPSDPDMVVLKGATIMAHMDTPIAKRLARFHYGMAVVPDTDLINSFNGTLTIAELIDIIPEFHVLIPKLAPIKVNDVIVEYEIPVSEGQKIVVMEIYASESDVPPKYVTEDQCRKIGTIKIRLSGIQEDTKLQVGMSCDGTEFKAVAREVQTGRCFAGVCRFLE